MTWKAWRGVLESELLTADCFPLSKNAITLAQYGLAQCGHCGHGGVPSIDLEDIIIIFTSTPLYCISNCTEKNAYLYEQGIAHANGVKSSVDMLTRPFSHSWALMYEIKML